MPDLFRAWQSPPVRTTEAVIKQYELGFAGALHNQEAHERFLDGVAIKTGEDVCRLFQYEDTAAGQLILPGLECMKAYPGCLPGGGQLEGDCVSWNQRNANLMTLVCEAIAGLPDPVSGFVEELPTCSPLAIKNGVFSTEAIYWYRSDQIKPGHGWFCPEAARISQTKAGLVLRQKYGDIDLERYTEDTVNLYNRKDPSEELTNIFDDHIIREATVVKLWEAVRDLLARGFGISTCGSEGFSKARDENGVCVRSGSWAHAMAFMGADDRPWAHQKYGCGLVLVQNSWNEYLTGSRKIHDTNLEIPPGSFWARWKDVMRRSMIAMAGANGWARRKLPDYNTGFV